MTIPVFISKLIPTQGEDTYDGCRVAVFNTRREALEDLVEWTEMAIEGDITEPLPADQSDDELEERLEACAEIKSWAIGEQTLDTNERPGV